jgi:hypothetical protein
MRKGNQILTALSSTVFSCGLFTRLVVSVLVIGIIYVDLHEMGIKSSFLAVVSLTVFEV